ncbi:MAG: hypothetical protein DMG48_05230 [Acidobacteria bacterium]|nr:MAG: hypothetical protein DMG48_05230 [Acidobacteriota bacterium]
MRRSGERGPAVRLPRYNVTITISDPDDPKTKAEFTLERFARDTLLRMELLGMLVEDFERGGDNGDDAENSDGPTG